METHSTIFARIREYLSIAAESDFQIHESSNLADLGVTSLHLITMLLTLQKEYSFDTDRVAQFEMPVTVGDLVALVERRMQTR